MSQIRGHDQLEQERSDCFNVKLCVTRVEAVAALLFQLVVALVDLDGACDAC